MVLGIFDDDARMRAIMDDHVLVVEASGSSCFLSELGQQFGWLGAALRPSPFEYGINTCGPITTRVETHQSLPQAFGRAPFCKIHFEVSQRAEKHLSEIGQCWQGLFKNRLVVKGYPIRRRLERNTGLELPLSMMAELVLARRVTLFKTTIYLKGFCAMLALVKQVGELMLWHFLFNQDGAHISYLDPRLCRSSEHFSVIVHSGLEKARHIVGWCDDVKVQTGGCPKATSC